MGGGQSSTPTAVPPAGKITNNNNKKDVVVIAVDASKQAEAAFLWYVNHIHKPGNEVRIMHWMELQPFTPVMENFSGQSWEELVAKSRKDGRDLVEKYENQLQRHQLMGSVHFEMGSPATGIVNAANKFGASHVIMGTRGYGVVRRTVLGSVSEYVLHHTAVPVTVVPPEIKNWFF